MHYTTDPLASLTQELDVFGDVEPPPGMWDRFVARLEAEAVDGPLPVRTRVHKPVLVHRLALVPTR